MTRGQVCLRRGEERKLLAGSNWIFDNQIDWVDQFCADGSVVEVLDSRQRPMGLGFFNGRSKIAVRMLTRDVNETVDGAFLRRRIEAAWQSRRLLGFENACRVVFGEPDGLPGLTVDKFDRCLSFQIVSLGMARFQEEIVQALVGLFDPVCVFERNDVPVREKEGLPLRKGCVYGAKPEALWIREHDAWMRVDIENGQKTGHFLDQQENRGRLKPYCSGRAVLDLCCHTGGFGIHAALYGAETVEAVDVSEAALAMVRENAARNGVSDRVRTTCANVFDLARQYADEGRRFGAVICDPPAFAKSRRALDAAYRGYKELNLRCMQMLEPGGFLLTCSCSQFMTQPLFEQMLREAAADSGRSVRLLERLMQSRDHPAALAEEHAAYLKGCILQAL
ncbi:MAG: class I SAM-dependent rRNA methyltransferase [Candidatus Faecousia sp.]|uniref:class I SAM-dependent rRNA methyltransferase n=1 Tax=Faecousia sp. TaxID=2952921 RepID=UPI002A89D233|nr:class I SAM-dependent rRNA methyltransferase [Candidatus Faecousia sp.]